MAPNANPNPNPNPVQILERWRAGHGQADVSVVVAAGVAPDDAAAQLVSQLAAFIKKRAHPVTTPPALFLASQLLNCLAWAWA